MRRAVLALAIAALMLGACDRKENYRQAGNPPGQNPKGLRPTAPAARATSRTAPAEAREEPVARRPEVDSGTDGTFPDSALISGVSSVRIEWRVRKSRRSAATDGIRDVPSSRTSPLLRDHLRVIQRGHQRYSAEDIPEQRRNHVAAQVLRAGSARS